MNIVAETLHRAADLIDTGGLWKFGCGHSGFCTLTSVMIAAAGNNAAEMAAHLAIMEHLGVPDATFVVRWNDTPGRTKAEVVAALRDAAVTAEAQAIVSGALSHPVAVFEVTAK